mgnify:FL=1
MTTRQQQLPVAVHQSHDKLPDATHHGREKLYPLGEEIAHAVTHGLGAVLAIAGLTVLVAYATRYGDSRHIVGSAIFGSTLVLMYTASTLYHSIPLPRARKVLRIIDHTMIFFLIAGSYTPFTLVTLNGRWGWILFGITWGLALAGVVFKVFTAGRFRKLSLAIYLGMGWCAIVAIRPLIETLATGGLVLLVIGGLCYTGGVVFYVRERLRYHHAIWHVFVLAGSAFHYFAVLFYVIPGAP